MMASSSKSDPNSTLSLDNLYSTQSALLERMRIHQRNLQELLKQKAQYGIAVPLAVVNGIKHEEQAIHDIDQELSRVKENIDAATKQSVTSPSLSESVPVSFNIDGIGYTVEAPYPLLGLRTTMSPDGQMNTLIRFVGGFEIGAASQPNQGMRLDFHRHGRQVSPIMNKETAKLILPISRPVTVGKVALNTRNIETIDDISTDRITEGRWTVLSPGMPLQTVVISEWPQGSKGYYTTTQVKYEEGELWMVQPPGTRPVQMWFYLDDWNVVPSINERLLCLAFPGSQVVSKLPESDPQNLPSETIKILFLAANPTDTERLRLDEEIRSIDEALRQSEFRDRFEIVQHWAVRVVDMQGYLLRHKPDIVHFSGHGSKTSQIVLENSEGKANPVPPQALSQLFSTLKDNVRLVVLNACYSEQQGQAIAEHIACVVGMSRTVADSTAISFTRSFYQALGYGRSVKTAFDLGCVEVNLENLSGQDVPKLLAPQVDPSEVVFVQGD